MHYEYQTKGTCSSRILFDIEDGKLKNVEYIGGCNGNLQGIGALVKGMPAQEAITRLKGIRCGGKPTSCPDQLAQGLEKILTESGK